MMMMNWMRIEIKEAFLQKATGKIFSTDQRAKLVHNTNFSLNLNTHCKCHNASINFSYAHPQSQGNVGHLHTLSAPGVGYWQILQNQGSGISQP